MMDCTSSCNRSFEKYVLEYTFKFYANYGFLPNSTAIRTAASEVYALRWNDVSKIQLLIRKFMLIAFNADSFWPNM